MQCEFCQSGQLTEGSLEGVSFEPCSEKKRILSKGAYGITCVVCLDCGRIDRLRIDPEAVRRLL